MVPGHHLLPSGSEPHRVPDLDLGRPLHLHVLTFLSSVHTHSTDHGHAMPSCPALGGSALHDPTAMLLHAIVAIEHLN
jgi:hypothetical protein